MRFDRRSGVLLHPTALPGPHGIGDLGAGARSFLDFLDRADQSVWQVCPLGPTAGIHGHSPYQTFSGFAGNPLLVDLAELADRGYLTDDELSGDEAGFSPHEVNYDAVESFKLDRLRTAFDRFRNEGAPDEHAAFADYREREADWLADYTLFRALKAEFGGELWTEWPEPARTRDPETLAAYREDLADEVGFRAFCQWTFDRQWADLRAYAQERGIGILGDLPIYVALDSADVWAAPEAFDLTDENRPATVAGVPPNQGDGGQRWGNPVYDWERLAETDYAWWLDRLRRLFEMVDYARLDHFKGFDEFWAIPADSDDPATGEWREGPRHDFFEAVRAEFGDLPFVAEDLGFLDPDSASLREAFDLPGMRVPQYADWCQQGHLYQPMHYPEDSVGYTSTHDSDTVVGYYESLGAEQRDCLHYNLGTDGSEIEWDVIEAVWNSDATLAVTTMQDLLGLDSHARFNTPGTAEGNWRWRVTGAGLDDAVADRLSRVTDATVR
ncbi:4-alpha-glucanotransferase [Halobaculum marinum]|uniref:4-alpha-glucanotransferase n=1 Tax=Halobaculum marinum TaxID=3031996 RepID=A0ABD5WRR3_9EURY|nr:4-alpha-glucanotransferase [Halobaculum sp. DT55]